jgi:tetratricopeptide (TPR) repeat protein
MNAAADLEQALSIFAGLGDDRWAARTRLSMASLSRRQREWDRASEHAESALRTFRTIADQPAEGWALREFGIVLREQERYDEARDALAKAERIFAGLGDHLWQARALASRPRVDPGSSAVALDAARELCRGDGVTDAERIDWVLSEW